MIDGSFYFTFYFEPMPTEKKTVPFIRCFEIEIDEKGKSANNNKYKKN